MHAEAPSSSSCRQLDNCWHADSTDTVRINSPDADATPCQVSVEQVMYLMYYAEANAIEVATKCYEQQD